MDVNLADPTTIMTAVGFLLLVSFLAVKYLIDHSFKQQEKLKNLEGQIITGMLTKFREDIDGLGSKLRGFKSAMESFQLSVAEMTLQHRTLDLRVQQLEFSAKHLETNLEKKVSDILTIELYNLSKDKAFSEKS